MVKERGRTLLKRWVLAEDKAPQDLAFWEETSGLSLIPPRAGGQPPPPPAHSNRASTQVAVRPDTLYPVPRVDCRARCPDLEVCGSPPTSEVSKLPRVILGITGDTPR